MNHEEATKLLIHFSWLSIHRSIKRKDWQTLKIGWYDFLVECENKYQKNKSIFKKRLKNKK